MDAAELYRSGKLDEAIQAAGAQLRTNPQDLRARTFLFELLCFAGDYDRAQKQLQVLASAGGDAATGALLYHSALHAERKRQEMFAKREYPKPPEENSDPVPISGVLNGEPFEELADADPRMGAKLEVYAAGDYLWIPLEHVSTVNIEPPRRLRDLLWIPAQIKTGPGFQDMELGEVLTPALAPGSAGSADDNVRLGRATVWEEADDGQAIPLGQKMLLVDGEEFPYLEIRSLVVGDGDTAA